MVGLFVAPIVLLVGPLVERVPMPALAALLIVAGFQGMCVVQAAMAWKTGRISKLVVFVAEPQLGAALNQAVAAANAWLGQPYGGASPHEA